MKLKSFGCSFIFGTDLPDDGRLGPLATPSHCTYPALIAAKKGFDYSCHARPGAGNFEILGRITDEIPGDRSCVYIINWSWIERFSYINDHKATHHLHPFNPRGWQSIMPIDDTELAKVYYRDAHAQLRDKFESLISIKTAIDFLRQADIPFIMTWTDSLIWETKFHCPPMIEWLQNEIRPYLSAFDGQSFLAWSQQQGFEISATMHPLEEAHEAAAELILSQWDLYIRS